MAVSPTLSALTALLSPTSLPSDAPPTTEDPLQRHFSAIVGVPVGIGLAILILGSCALYLFLSAYIKHRREEREQATNTTNISKWATGGRNQPKEKSSDSGGGGVSSPPLSPVSPTSPSSYTDTKM
jgi:hypothetical protein